MDRVVNLGIQFELDYLPRNFNRRTKISLPKVQVCRLHGGDDIISLHGLDLSGMDTLEWSSTAPTPSSIGILPNQLTNLTLRRFQISVKGLPGSQPYFLPNLVILKLQEILMDDVLDAFFKCSRLKRLYYQSCAYALSNPTGYTNRRSRRVIDEAFIQQTSLLEHISLQGVTLNFALPLQLCRHLCSLIIDDCLIGEFLLTFVDSLQEPASFPSLQLLQIDNSWPSDSQMSYQEFARRCVTKRPSLWISGNEQQKLPFPYLDTESPHRPLPYRPWDQVQQYRRAERNDNSAPSPSTTTHLLQI